MSVLQYSAVNTAEHFVKKFFLQITDVNNNLYEGRVELVGGVREVEVEAPGKGFRQHKGVDSDHRHGPWAERGFFVLLFLIADYGRRNNTPKSYTSY